MPDNLGEQLIEEGFESAVPLGSIGAEVIEKVLERALPEKNFAETEPNNTRDQANDLGRLLPLQPINISGHVNGSSDPYDYFDYVATEPGLIAVDMTRGGEVIYHHTFTAHQANEPFWYQAWATGNADFDYETQIFLSPYGDQILV